MERTEIIIGPLETKWGIALIGLDNKKVYLISLDFSAFLRYAIIGIDKLRNKKLKDLISKYKTVDIDRSALINLQVKKSYWWKNYIKIEYDNKAVKWNILKRYETENYEKIFNNWKNNNVC